MKEKVHDVKLNWDAYVIIDPNSIHKKRPSTLCTRSFLCHLNMYGKPS